VAREARDLLGEIETVQVKEGISRVAARCLHPQVAQQRIREAAERALRLTIPPLVLPSPITVRVVFQRALHADLAELTPGSQRVDGRTVKWEGEDMPSVYKAFRAMTALAAHAG
jgi:D-amino peptidase